MRAPLERLSSILRAFEEASRDRARIEALLAVMAGDPFEGAALFNSAHDGTSFVLMASRGLDPKTMRRWKRWPLLRLFARMKPARILDPAGSGGLALATPLIHGVQRHVVVAPIRDAELSPEYEAFYAALESITMPRGEDLNFLADDFPIGPAEPAIVAFSLCADLERRLSLLLLSRGWSLTPFSSAARLFDCLAANEADILLLDLDDLGDAASMLRLVNRATLSPLQIMAFGSQAHFALASVLTDCIVSHDADDAQIFAGIKRLVRKMATRSTRLDKTSDPHEEGLDALRRPEDLARFAAVRAAEIAHGWAGITLISESGTVHFAEYPRRDPPILSKIPPSFLRDGPLFALHVDEQLLDEISDDAASQAELVRLEPVSGVLLPIDGHRRLGVLTALSIGRRADAGVFESLVGLGRDVGARFQKLIHRREVMPEFARDGLWEHWSNRALQFAVYRSSDCAIPWRYSALTGTRGLLTLGNIDGASVCWRLGASDELGPDEVTRALAESVAETEQFAAVVNSDARSIVYAAHDFSPPFVLGSRGPSGLIAAGRHVTTGVAALDSTAQAVVCDRELWRWFGERRATLPELPSLLDVSTPPGLALLIRLGS